MKFLFWPRVITSLSSSIWKCEINKKYHQIKYFENVFTNDSKLRQDSLLDCHKNDVELGRYLGK